jgi:hypothetical protein
MQNPYTGLLTFFESEVFSVMSFTLYRRHILPTAKVLAIHTLMSFESLSASHNIIYCFGSFENGAVRRNW